MKTAKIYEVASTGYTDNLYFENYKDAAHCYRVERDLFEQEVHLWETTVKFPTSRKDICNLLHRANYVIFQRELSVK